MKPHVSINVSDFERSLAFYRAFFGLEPGRVRPGYAKFDVEQPPLNFTINQRDYKDAGALNHLGLQMSSADDVLAAKKRLIAAGMATSDEMNTTCCYAVQDKIWVTDPDGNRWEVFVVLSQEDDRKESVGQVECGATSGTCCTPAGSTPCCAS
ncbi:MAG: VOC family protein [Alicyclobacillus shizuokensis]|nr:VOC family protein [Alicyclobacillus shizuokensis]